MNTDEATASEHHHHAALLGSDNQAESLLDQQTLPSACESMRAITADESGRAVGFGPDQHPASGDDCLSQQLVEDEQRADHEQHVMISHGREASAAALDSQLALNVDSLSISKTPDDRLSSGWCPIVDVQDTDLLGMDTETHQQHQEDYTVTLLADTHAKASKHDPLSTTAAAAGPLMTANMDHMPTTAVAGQDAAMGHADEVRQGSGHSWGFLAAQQSSVNVAQVTLLVNRPPVACSLPHRWL